MSNKSIEVKDFLLEALEQEYNITLTIGYIEINGIIKEIKENSVLLQCEDLDLSVVF